MGTKTTTKRSAGSKYEWRWMDEFESKTFTIPDSWAANGRTEDPSDGDELFYAIEAKSGLLMQFTVDGSGQSIAGPHREREVLKVRYVNSSGRKAVVCQGPANNSSDGVAPTDDFASVIAISDDQYQREYGSPAEAKQLIAEKYGSEGVCHDGE